MIFQILIKELKDTNIKMNKDLSDLFNELNISIPTSNITYYDLLKRPEINFDIIDKLHDFNYSDEVKEEVYIETKYIGYINKELKEVEKLKKLEEKKIPKDIDYDKVRNLASEARQKLKEIRPITLGQASRISGVNPVDISLLGIYLKKEYNKND